MTEEKHHKPWVDPYPEVSDLPESYWREKACWPVGTAPEVLKILRKEWYLKRARLGGISHGGID